MEEIDGWLGRDENEELWLYGLPPYKSLGDQWKCREACRCMKLNPNLFPEIKWSDEKPTKVKIVIEK